MKLIDPIVSGKYTVRHPLSHDVLLFLKGGSGQLACEGVIQLQYQPIGWQNMSKNALQNLMIEVMTQTVQCMTVSGLFTEFPER